MPTDRKPAEGRRGKGVSRRPRRAKLSPLDRYQRGRKIAEMRARERPVAWRDIAADVGMSEAGAKDAHAQFLSWEEPLHDPMDALQETIDALTVSMRLAFETYEAADPGSSVRVQAVRTTVDTALIRLQVLRAAGRAPRSLSGPSVAQQLQVVFREFAELLSRHKVSDAALREFLEFAELQMGKASAIEGTGRSLPSAA